VFEHYDDFINMTKKIDGQKAKLEELLNAINIASARLNLVPEVAEMLKSLTRLGVRKDDFKNIARMIIENYKPQSKGKAASTGSKNDNSIHTDEVIAKNEKFVGVSEANTDVNQPPDVQIQISSSSAGTGKPRNGQLIKTSSSKPLFPPRMPKKSLLRGKEEE